ncbi:hypothetical protein [Streptosporangium sp. KLBMP 9127]|nr:hypothetical protein [Streptosporangium sp. KLBMP 9127]
MLKQLIVGGTLIAGFTGLGLNAPAHADGPWPGWPPGFNNVNNAMQSNIVNACGNSGIGDIGLNLLNVASPITSAHSESVGCNSLISQE